ICWNKALERHHLDRRLNWSRFLQHAPVNQKPPANARGLSAVWAARKGRYLFMGCSKTPENPCLGTVHVLDNTSFRW
ncbi:hypothetical protein, partial [Nitratireductor aestuarii]|uniref:hypothetical protein n=1 Tax=Nitratireductor aestuarii TaxID=1735103 RepID=UPI001AEEB917